MIGDLVLVTWSGLLGISFIAYYHHPKTKRPRSFLTAGISFIAYAFSRYFYLRAPDGATKELLLVLHLTVLLVAFVSLAATIPVVHRLWKQR